MPAFYFRNKWTIALLDIYLFIYLYLASFWKGIWNSFEQLIIKDKNKEKKMKGETK
jgi:hypothetical protein